MTDRLVDGRQKNFFWHENEYVDGGHISLIGTDAHAVYTCLVRHAGADGTCFPSQTKLMAETGLTKPSIIKSVEWLIWLGYIVKLETGNSKGHANTYKILDLPSATSQRDLLVNVVNQSMTFTSTSKRRLLALVNDVYSKNTHGRIHIEENTLKSVIENLETSLGKKSNVIDLGDRLPSQNFPTGQKNQSGIAPKNKSGVKDQSSVPGGVFVTAKVRDPAEIVKGLIAEMCGDRYQEFVDYRISALKASDYWRKELEANPKLRIVEGTILLQYARDLKIYRTDSEEMIAQQISIVAAKIKTHVEMSGVLSISGANQGQESDKKDLFEGWLAIYKNDPFEVKKIAGHRLQEFISWKNNKEEHHDVSSVN